MNPKCPECGDEKHQQYRMAPTPGHRYTLPYNCPACNLIHCNQAKSVTTIAKVRKPLTVHQVMRRYTLLEKIGRSYRLRLRVSPQHFFVDYPGTAREDVKWLRTQLAKAIHHVIEENQYS